MNPAVILLAGRVPETIKLRDMLPSALKKQLGKAGVYLHGIDYLDVDIQVETGPMPISPMGMTQIVHLRPGGNLVMTANQNKGTLVEFPILPAYATVAEGAYADFYAQKAQSVPSATMLRFNLDDARNRDALQPDGGTDHLEVSRELSRDAPQDTRQRLARLASALYAQEPGEPVSAALADSLMDPYVVLTTEIAIHDKWSYRKPSKGSAAPAVLTHQMREIQSLAPLFQFEVHTSFMQDRDGAAQTMQKALGALRPTVKRAEAFTQHLSPIVTLPTTGDSWRLRAR